MLNSDGIRHKLENLDKSIADYLSQLEVNDSTEDELDAAQEEIKQLKEKIAKLEAQRTNLETVGKALDASGKRQISPNDTDAVLVKGRDGKFAGYNVQTGVEPQGHFIMSNEVTTDPNDLNQLKNCIERATEETGLVPEEAVTKSETGRVYKRDIEQERIDLYKEKLKSQYSKERIAERKGIVEHPFGTIKWLMGKFQFLLVGKQKVQIEFNLYATAYNIKRLMGKSSISEILCKIDSYNWALA